MGLFGEEVGGVRAVELGLAWQAAEDAEVETLALGLARKAAADPPLARRTVVSFRAQSWPNAVPWPVAVEAERSARMWSLRRRYGA